MRFSSMSCVMTLLEMVNRFSKRIERLGSSPLCESLGRFDARSIFAAGFGEALHQLVDLFLRRFVGLEEIEHHYFI